jgi:hypothetical protein
MNWGRREFLLWYAWGFGVLITISLISLVSSFIRDFR